MSAREKFEKILEAIIFYANAGIISKQVAEKLIEKHKEILEKDPTGKLFEKGIDGMKDAVKKFFEFYKDQNISWKEKLGVILPILARGWRELGEEVYNEYMFIFEKLKDASEETVKFVMQQIKDHFILLYRVLEYNPNCKCGNKTYYELITYEGEIPIKIEYLCEKCGQELLNSEKVAG
jgi:hypothetical protein